MSIMLKVHEFHNDFFGSLSAVQPRRAPCTCDISGHTDVASTKALQTAQALCKSSYPAVS